MYKEREKDREMRTHRDFPRQQYQYNSHTLSALQSHHRVPTIFPNIKHIIESFLSSAACKDVDECRFGLTDENSCQELSLMLFLTCVLFE